MKTILKLINHLIFLMMFLATVNAIGQTPLFYDNFNQAPVNPIVSGGQPTANYTIWTT